MNERSFGKGAFSPQEPAPRGQDRGSHSGVRPVPSLPSLPDPSSFVDYNALPEEPTRILDRTGIPSWRTGLSESQRRARKQFDDMPVDPALLSVDEGHGSGDEDLPAWNRDQWYPSRDVSEYDEVDMRHGLAERNPYIQLQKEVERLRKKIDSIANRVRAERARRPPETLEALPSSYLEDDVPSRQESRQDRYNRYAHLAHYFEDLPEPVGDSSELEDLSRELEDDLEADAARAASRAAATSPGRRFPPQRAV